MYRSSISVGYTKYSSFDRSPIHIETTNIFHPSHWRTEQHPVNPSPKKEKTKAIINQPTKIEMTTKSSYSLQQYTQFQSCKWIGYEKGQNLPAISSCIGVQSQSGTQSTPPSIEIQYTSKPPTPFTRHIGEQSNIL